MEGERYYAASRFVKTNNCRSFYFLRDLYYDSLLIAQLVFQIFVGSGIKEELND